MTNQNTATLNSLFESENKRLDTLLKEGANQSKIAESVKFLINTSLEIQRRKNKKNE